MWRGGAKQQFRMRVLSHEVNKYFSDQVDAAWDTVQRCGARVEFNIGSLNHMVHAYEDLVQCCPKLQIQQWQYQSDPVLREYQLEEYEAIRLGFASAEHFIRTGAPVTAREGWKFLPRHLKSYLYAMESNIVIGFEAWPQD